MFHGFTAAGCVPSGFAVTDSVAAGFVALGSGAVGLVVVSLKQYQVYCPDAAEATSVTKTTEHNAAKPNAGKAVGSSGAVSIRCNNLLIAITD